MYRSFLLVDYEFRTLNIPLPPDKRKVMEEQIRKNRQTLPIPTWNSYVLCQYDTYELCEKHHMTFYTEDKYFPSRPHAIAWICRQQLLRNDLVKPARIWLLYRLYKAEKAIIKSKQSKDYFQYRQLSPSLRDTGPMIDTNRYPGVVLRLASEYRIHPDTLVRYHSFGKKLDQLENMFPGVRARVLTGKLDIQLNQISAVLEMPQKQLREMIDNPRCRKLTVPKDETPPNKPVSNRRKRSKIILQTAIKQTPEYDPDAVLRGLSYTVATWRKTLTQTREKPLLQTATESEKKQICTMLQELTAETNKLIHHLEEDTNERVYESDGPATQLHT